jgi:hypothetical protein
MPNYTGRVAGRLPLYTAASLLQKFSSKSYQVEVYRIESQTSSTVFWNVFHGSAEALALRAYLQTSISPVFVRLC